LRWRRVALPALLAAVLLVLVYIGGCLIPCVYNQPALEAELRRDLQSGSSSEYVDGYLAGKKISHSFAEKDRRIYGLIPDVCVTGPVSWSIALVFSFDENKRLAGLEVKGVGTGP